MWLTCTVLPVLGSQSHHKDTLGCYTGRHTSHCWSNANTAEQQNSFATDHQNSVSSLLRPSRRRGCCTGNRRCGFPPTRHTEGSRSSPPLPEAGWCLGQIPLQRSSPVCGKEGRWSYLDSCTGKRELRGCSGKCLHCNMGWRCRGCQWELDTLDLWRWRDTCSVGPGALTHTYHHSCNSDCHRSENHTRKRSRWSPKGNFKKYYYS